MLVTVVVLLSVCTLALVSIAGSLSKIAGRK